MGDTQKPSGEDCSEKYQVVTVAQNGRVKTSELRVFLVYLEVELRGCYRDGARSGNAWRDQNCWSGHVDRDFQVDVHLSVLNQEVGAVHQLLVGGDLCLGESSVELCLGRLDCKSEKFISRLDCKNKKLI